MTRSPRTLIVIYLSLAMYAVVRGIYMFDAVQDGQILTTDIGLKAIWVFVYIFSFMFIWKQSKNSYYVLLVLCFIPVLTLFRYIEVLIVDEDYISSFNIFLAFVQCIPIAGGMLLFKKSVKKYYSVINESA